MTIGGQAWDPHEMPPLALVLVFPVRASVSVLIPASTFDRTKLLCRDAENDSSKAQENNRAEKGQIGHLSLFGRGSKVFPFQELQLLRSSWSLWSCAHPITPSVSEEGTGVDLGTTVADRQRSIQAHECSTSRKERDI